MSDNDLPPMPPSSLPEQRPVPLVLLHGVGQSPIAWQDFVSAFGADRPLHAPWLPGLKPTEPIGFDLGTAASGLIRELQLQGMRRCDIVGVNVGASIALRIAAQEPALVRRLVVAGTILRPTAWALRAQKLALRVVPESRLVDAGVSRPRMLALVDALAHFDGTSLLQDVTAPTLVVAGARDRPGVGAARELRDMLPHAGYEVLPGAGTAVNADAPQALARVVREFLEREDA